MQRAAGHAPLFHRVAQTAKEHLDEDPKSDALFCFANKRGNRLKVLWFDRNGFCILSNGFIELNGPESTGR